METLAQCPSPPACSPPAMADDENNSVPDYKKFDKDSVPPPEKEIKHTHPGRPDLDYDDTPVGPAEGAEPPKE